MKVAVIGAGAVGTTLGAALLHSDQRFDVKYGVRNVASGKLKPLLEAQARASLAPVQEAVTWAEVIVLATPGVADDAGIRALAASLGEGVNGKVLIDATNPLTSYPELEVRWGQALSGGEVLAAALPGASVYKAFNTVGVEHMAAADGSAITGERLTMLVAGDPRPVPRRMAERVVAGVGFLPEFAGPIRYARNLEAIAELWIHAAVPGVGASQVNWGRNFHFQVVRRR